jgi:hypothetical protein
VRVVLIHDPSAGDEDHPAPDLVRRIEDGGHEVVADVAGRKALRDALGAPCDLVVAAGGDGTVNAAAQVLAGTGVPLTVIPLGTANNIAATLGCAGDAAELIAGWERGALHRAARAAAPGPALTHVTRPGRRRPRRRRAPTRRGSTRPTAPAARAGPRPPRRAPAAPGSSAAGGR